MTEVQETLRTNTSIIVDQVELRVAGREAQTLGLDPITVGRDPSVHVPVADLEVSAVHCELRATQRGVLLRDLGSRNGTWLGSARIDSVWLTPPATIRVGQTLIELAATGRRSAVSAGADQQFGELVGASVAMRRLFDALKVVSNTELSLLLNAETGTGKELVARAVHEASPRRNKPFVVIDCGAIPASLAEGILFGHEKGSFTGASTRSTGAFHDADGGTVFLDELGELPTELQPKLLRVLSEKSVKRIGSSKYEPLDVRVIAATRRDLRRDMNEGRFRSDLYFRLAQVRLELPPLRERRSDIPLLISTTCERIGRPHSAMWVTSTINSRYQNYDWPGNVRELVNVASVMASLPEGTDSAMLEMMLPFEGRARLDDAPLAAKISTTAGETFGQKKQKLVLDFERAYFEELITSCSGNISEMARRSGLERHHVRAYLRKLGITRNQEG